MICRCPKCKKEFNNTTNRTFCSRRCANSRVVSTETKKKIGLALHDKYKEPTFRGAIEKARERALNKVRCNRLMRKVKAKNGQELDITNKDLEEYRKTHFVCEICGKAERATHNKKSISKLCCDHDHTTSKFRGLLCSNCNRKLGWYETYTTQIREYLQRGKL